MDFNFQESMDLGDERTKTEEAIASDHSKKSVDMSASEEPGNSRLSPNLPDSDKTDRHKQMDKDMERDTIASDNSDITSPASNVCGADPNTVQPQLKLDNEANPLTPGGSKVDHSAKRRPKMNQLENDGKSKSKVDKNEECDKVNGKGVDSSSGSGVSHESTNSKSVEANHRLKGAGDNGSSDDEDNVMVTSEENVEKADDGGDSSDSSSSSSDSDIFIRHVGRKRPSKANGDVEEKVTPHVLFKEKPKHKWFVVQEVVNRQKGAGSRYHGSEIFRQRCYGSLHSVQRLELMYKLESHEGCVNTLHFNLAGTLLASGSDDLQIVIWNWATGQPLVKYDSGHRSNVFQAKFLPLSCNTHVVSCSRDGQVRLAELSSTGVCRSTRKLGYHRGPVHKLAIQTETPHVFLSCGEDALVMSIDVRETKPSTVTIVKDHERKIALYGIHSNPMNNNEFCINGRNNFIRIYDKRYATVCIKKYCPQHLMSTRSFTQVTSAMFNYNGTEVLGSYNDEDIYLFDTSLGEDSDYVHKYEGHRNNVTVKGVNFFGPKSEYIVSGSDCGNIFFWDKHTEAIVQWMAGDENGVVNCLEPHPQIPVIATSGLDSDVKIWVPSCEKEPSLDGLKEIVVSNYIDRENENHRQPDSIDSQMLMMLWRHMRRTERRKQERASQNGSGSRGCGQSAQRPPSSSDSSDSDDDNNTTFEQCTPS